MKIIKTKFFDKQIEKLEKNYPKIKSDLTFFEKNLLDESYFSELWHWIYKYRLKNSSIPVWKRGWFRIILKRFWYNFIFLLIYSKTLKENVDKKEINNALKQVLKEL